MNTIKKNNFRLVILIIALVIGFICNFNATERGINNCYETDLSAPSNSVLEGDEIQFKLEYTTSSSNCTATDIQGEKIVVDFSNIVSNGNDITYSIDSSIFDIDISSSGVVTLIFKDLSTNNQTLVGLGGNVIFSMPAKSVDENQQVIVTTNGGDHIAIEIIDIGESSVNTNKSSLVNYVEVGDTVTYQVLINNHENVITDFHGVDSHTQGLEYVDGSFYAQQDQIWLEMSDYFTASYDSQGRMVIDNTKSFDVPVLLTYDMTITDPTAIYHNQFEASYNQQTPEIVGDDIWYDLDSDSWVNYKHGLITITKHDQQGNPLSGAEFDVIDSAGNIVEHLITDGTGHAESSKLQLGTYTIVETVAPVGYQIDPSSYHVVLSSEQLTASIQSFGEIIDDSQNYIHIRLMNELNEGIAEVSFGIYDANGNLIDTIVTDENGNATSKYLKPGKYYLQQLDTINGYLLNPQKYWFEIGADNNELEYKIVNQKITGSLEVGAVDDQNQYLLGAEFSVYNSNGELVAILSTGETGVQSLANLEYGSYYIIQTKAAAGYAINQQKYYFKIEHQGDRVTIKIPNSQDPSLAITNPQISIVSGLSNQNLVVTGSSANNVTTGLLVLVWGLFGLKRYVTI